MKLKKNQLQRELTIFREIVLLILLLPLTLNLHAQVTIGGGASPQDYSVLELISSGKRGLRMPHMGTSERDKISDPSSFKTDAKGQGLTIFNTTSGCIEFWNIAEKQWMSLCGEKTGLVEFSSCELIKVIGVYDMDRPLSQQTVRIDIPVVVKKQGLYSYSAMCNGVTFRASGMFTSLGPVTVSLFVDPDGGNPISTGTYPATVTISPVYADPDPTTVICNNLSIKFVSRSTSILKILNIAGDENFTGLTSDGGNHSSTTVYSTIGRWLQGASTTIDGTLVASPITYSGTSAVQVVNVDYKSMAQLQNALKDASIVWVGATEKYSYGFAQLLKEWSKAGKGIIMITGDKIGESTVSDALGYYIEDGSASTGTFYGTRLPQLFSSTFGAPFNLGDGLQIGYSGSNCGYVSSNNGVTFMTVSSHVYPSAFADIDNEVFIFGDKFGSVSSGTTWNNFAKILVDIFAWSMKNAPIN